MDMQDLASRIKAVERAAAQTCSLADMVFERIVQAGYALLLAGASKDDRAKTEAAPRAEGYEPERHPFSAEEGQCTLTRFHCRMLPLRESLVNGHTV